MIAVSGNRVYQIEKAEVEARRAAGYDIYSEDGELIAYSLNKKVPYSQYEEALKEIEALKLEIEQLKAPAEEPKKKGK